ncbi:MAG: helix-turn-helix transcriptional regulator [Bacillota bacterium]
MEKTQIKTGGVTELLLDRLFKAPDLKTYMRDNAGLMEVPPFYLLIAELCKKAGISKAVVIEKANIPRNYGYQIFNGIRNPSRDKVIQLAFGFGMDVENAQELLKAAREAPLYARIPRESVILRCLYEQKDVIFADDALAAMGLTPLGREDKNE